MIPVTGHKSRPAKENLAPEQEELRVGARGVQAQDGTGNLASNLVFNLESCF